MPHDEHDWDKDRLDTLRREIRERLRSVCAGLEPGDFAKLVDRIARTQRKYEQRATLDFLSANLILNRDAQPP